MTTVASPMSLKAWRHHLRVRTTSMIAVTAAVATLVGGWLLAVIVGNRVPSPADTLGRLAAEQSAGELWHQLALSTNRFVLGLALALIVGAALGVLMGLSRPADLALSDLTMAGLAIRQSSGRC